MTSAALHGGAAAVLLASSAIPPGAAAPEVQPHAVNVELINAARRQSGDQVRTEAQSRSSEKASPVAAAPASPTSGEAATAPMRSASGGEAALPAAAPDPGAVSDYYRRVESHLARFHAYPAALTGPRPTGVVRVGLIVQRDGRVMDAWIETSSGVVPLDEAALQTLKRAEPLPGLPATLPGAIDLIVPLRYAASTRGAGVRVGE
ncbi:Gram-negative bacterial tonB protein [compost metagenome]